MVEKIKACVQICHSTRNCLRTGKSIMCQPSFCLNYLIPGTLCFTTLFILLFIRTHMKTNSLAVLLVLRVIDPFQCSLLKYPSVSCPPHPVHQSMSVPAASHPHLTWLKSAALHPGLLGSIELQDIAVGIKLNTQCILHK